MFPTQQGSYRLFTAGGINVWVHWSWLLVAFWVLSNRQGHYDSPVWNVIEYLTLFAIVLLHEFGHALACRQVGGQANKIVLWPLGGVAYVAPPYRAGAQLWSIAAGPLVNVILLPVLAFAPEILAATGGTPAIDVLRWLSTVEDINQVLLVFNLLPIYPLDGGQILRSLLWFGVGPRKSLRFASAIGILGAGLLVIFAIWIQHIFGGIIAIFLGINSWKAFRASKAE